MNQQSMRAAILERVSTEEQTRGYGLDVQDDACRAYVENKGWRLHDVYRDEGVSGSLTKRPGFDRLMADVKAGLVDVVVVHKFDRVGRTGRAFWRWIWQLEDLDTAIVSVTQDIDTTTTHGKFMLQQYAAIAEMEYNLIRERTQGGLQKKAEAGGWPGGAPPYGYRIEGKGKRGSFLVIDEHEAAILQAARKMAVEEGMNTREMAQRLNALEMFTRSGKPWSHSNLRGKLISESTLRGVVTFRNPKRAHAGHGAALNKDGTAKHGATVTIQLDPIFTPEEAADLSAAMGRLGNGKPKPKPHGYPLSKRLVGHCGAHYVGMKRSGRPGRWYRCTGRAAKYPGDPVCSCDMVDADAVEAAVWADVVKLLGDPDRLKAMAAEWVGMATGEQTNHADRIADLDRRITERTGALTKLVTDYAKAGLPAVALQAATRALTEEVEQLQAMRDEAAAWMEETEAAEQRARDLAALAAVARERLADMDPAEQSEVLALLDVRVTITGEIPKPRLGLACSMRDWFTAAQRLVPDELTDEAWARVEPIVKAWEPPSHRCRPGRVMLDAMFYKARTGCLWEELPERFGLWKGIHSRYKTWRNCGVWDEIMAALPDEGQPVWTPPLVPPLRVEGRVDPRVFTGAEEEAVSAETGVPGPATSGLSAGVHALLRQDAVLVTDAAEVVELVGDMGDLAPEHKGPVLPRDLLDPAARHVLAALPAHRDAEPQEIARAAQTTPDDAIARLYELRALGYVERHGDGWKLTRQAMISVRDGHTAR
ncbi:recombinase family protein [Streptomyces virens]|uniref:Recombinase family protein n=1 Tax=Streptomyces virens TaxID=285572 RepID=A0ABP6PJI0_9ACTN|nr:DNA invertase Pin-like site-specific DNA recombinase/transposase [Streptomyces calvus]MYS31611.1 recombinase family protein [Streptomyces sp. SID7804]